MSQSRKLYRKGLWLLMATGLACLSLLAILTVMLYHRIEAPAQPVQSCQLGWYGKLKPGPCADYTIPKPRRHDG